MVVERKDNISWIDFKIIAFRFSTLFCFLIYLFFSALFVNAFHCNNRTNGGKEYPHKTKKEREGERKREMGDWAVK